MSERRTRPMYVTGTDIPRLYRRRSGRVVAGVAIGISDHLGFPVVWVRAVFAMLAALGGAGILGYGLLWIFVRQRSDIVGTESERERRQGVGLLLLGVGLAAVVASVSAVPPWLVGAMGATLVGGAVIWREADESQRGQWREGARSSIVGLLGGGGRAGVLRLLAGVALVFLGLCAFVLATIGSEVPVVLAAVVATLVGVALLTVPWWMRLSGDLDVERSTRIRSQERAELAAHLHDSVLQTLALIQKQAGAEREVRRLARSQERELRRWLYGPGGYSGSSRPMSHAPTASPGTSGEESAATGEFERLPEETLAAELARICGEVEDAFAITVQHVVVGDGPLDEPLRAVLAAAREAIVNAAKHAGVDEVSVYAESQPDRVELFVRDRGAGFDPDEVDPDRHGLSESIRGRMERNGGRVRLRTSPGAGTEIHLDLPRVIQ
ncbi:phage shock protein C (PspC) family protein [Actinopolyspora alba]|uniref:Phage shock protein C (PspC) family protein n=1 Tax=Actinopolyspora alba TaxID=673379 RepID=A0A1I1U1X0_9ACTN|nr:ATP-binding protein [Actinopolyspora alba]SFD63608.1 phage shock protein C (PspC) family protein [Actinopolyspora alba]